MTSTPFRRLALITTVAVYLLLILGGIVSGTGSGMGCGPDWPLCNGRLIPSFGEPELWIEWGHRLLAALVGLLVLATSAVAWWQARSFRPIPLLAGIALVLLLTQVTLGAVTVRLGLSPEASTAHLAIGVALFAVLLMMTTLASRRDGVRVGAPQGLLWLAIGVTYAQMVLGGYVRHSGAGLGCPDVPLCLGQIIPPLYGPILGHFLHRLGGLIVLGFVHAAAGRVLRATQEPLLRGAAVGAIILVIVQIMLGVLAVTTRLSIHVTTTHLAVALALLGLLVFLSVRLRLETRATVESVAARREEAIV